METIADDHEEDPDDEGTDDLTHPYEEADEVMEEKDSECSQDPLESSPDAAVLPFQSLARLCTSSLFRSWFPPVPQSSCVAIIFGVEFILMCSFVLGNVF